MRNLFSRKPNVRRPRVRQTAKPMVECLEERSVPAVIVVGTAAGDVATIAQAASMAQNGDTIQIQAGTYTSQEAIFTQSNLTIQGIGGTPVFNDNGYTIQNQKGIFDIRGNNVTVENITFEYAHDLTGASKNYCGVRGEGNTLTLQNCTFLHNDDGILINNDPNFTTDNNSLLVSNCEFGYNGYGDGQSHNMYIGEISSFTLQYSYSHDANQGHDVKSRALVTHLLYNYIADGPSGGGSSEIDIPYGGTAYLIGNVIEKDASAANHNFLTFDTENGPSQYAQQLYAVNNTFVNDYGGGTYLFANTSNPASVLLENNIFAGGGTIANVAYSNVTNLVTNSPGFANWVPGTYLAQDYQLAAGSPAINAGTQPGSANGFSLVPTSEYVDSLSSQARPVNGTIDIGAYEYGTSVSVPTAPTGLAASAGNGQVALSWTASSGATSYNLYRGTTSGGETLLVSGLATTSYTNTGLTNGSTYYYEVTAVNTAGQSGFSSQVSATPQVPAPAAPSGLTATAGSGQVTLTWSASSGATSYNIYKGTSSGGETLFASGISGTSDTVTGLTNGTTYYFEVSATNAGGTSGMSSQVSATPQAAVTVPAAPTGLSAKSGNGQAVLSWTASSGATSYNVYRGTSSGGETLIASGVTGTSYTSTSLTNGDNYYFKVTAVNSAGQSGFSSEVAAWPQAPGGIVWVEDGTPIGASLAADGGDAWTWSATNPAPHSGSLDQQSSTASGEHQHYFTGASQTMAVGSNDTLYAWVYLNPNSPPQEVMLQWNVGGSWEHRAYWGANDIGWGTNGTVSRQYMGALPATGGWVRLAVPASAVGLGGQTVNGMAFTLYGGQADFDQAGTVSAPAAPTGLTASAGSGQVALSWTASSGATKYNLYRSTSSGTEVLVASGITGTSYTNTGLSNGSIYYFRVSAVNANGESALSNEVSATPKSSAVTGTGTGLTGQYYSDTSLSNLVLTRTDPTVSFTWTNDTAPISGLPNDNWSVKWTGQVQAQYSQAYTFKTVSDDGVRLYVNGQLVINDWTYHGATTDTSAAITLQAGQKYAIEMDYFEGSGAATAQLSWSSPSTPAETIPTSQLYTASVSVNLGSSFNREGMVSNGTAFSGGLDGDGSALSANLLGPTVAWKGQTFQLAAANTNNVISAQGQTINLPAGNFSTLSFLAAGVNGNQPNLTFTVHYTDGTSQTFTQSISDWYTPQNYAGESTVVSTAYRNTSSGGTQNGPFNVYGYQFALNSGKTVQSISLPNNGNVEILAMNLTL